MNVIASKKISGHLFQDSFEIKSQRSFVQSISFLVRHAQTLHAHSHTLQLAIQTG
jgi:hypothetical protein